MTWEAVDTILSKAWESDAHALIKVDKVELNIDKENYDWVTYPTINILCIYSKQYNREYYCDIDNIRNITIVFNEPRRDKGKTGSVE